MNHLKRVLYKSLLREAGCGTHGALQKNTRILLTDPIAFVLLGSGSPVTSFLGLADRAYRWTGQTGLHLEFVANWAASLPKCADPLDIGVTRNDLVDLIRSEFRRQKADPTEMVTRVSAALNVLHKVRKLSTCTTISQERGVRVELSIRVMSDQDAQGADGTHFLLYRLRLANESAGLSKVQLLGRHWIFRNDEGKQKAVVNKYADGVVGQKPILTSQASLLASATSSGNSDSAVTTPETSFFEYVSGTQMSTPTGTMNGSFLFEDLATGEMFEVAIKETRFA